MPNKVENFLWRACSNSLPTREILKLKKITTDGLCPICCLVEESVIQITWNFLASSDIWALSTCHIWPNQMTNVVQLIKDMHLALDSGTLKLNCFIMRNQWLKRNNLLFNQLFLSPNKVILTASSGFSKFKTAVEHSRQ